MHFKNKSAIQSDNDTKKSSKKLKPNKSTKITVFSRLT